MAGHEILRDGGEAIDAAVAAVVCMEGAHSKVFRVFSCVKLILLRLPSFQRRERCRIQLRRQERARKLHHVIQTTCFPSRSSRCPSIATRRFSRFTYASTQSYQTGPGSLSRTRFYTAYTSIWLGGGTSRREIRRRAY